MMSEGGSKQAAQWREGGPLIGMKERDSPESLLVPEGSLGEGGRVGKLVIPYLPFVVSLNKEIEVSAPV